MIRPAQNVVLALETAIRGGSVALFVDGAVVGTLSGNETISRAEELIFGIDSLLQASSLEQGDLSMIAVSNGPGSYTGERIGIATALGLGTALDVPVVGVQLLIAMRHAGPPSGAIVAAVPVGSQDVAWAETDTANGIVTATGPSSIGSTSDFFAAYRAKSARAIVVHEELFQRAVNQPPSYFHKRLINAGHDLAVFVGLEALNSENLAAPRPLYLLNQSRASSLF